jgi:uncharacterized Zn-binding protein involved in type VI secretion
VIDRPFIRVGDKTTHGGTVMSGDITFIVDNKPVARVGDLVMCPQCKGTFPIVSGAMTIFSVKPVALKDDLTACGAKLIPTQFLSGWDGASDGYAPSRSSYSSNSNAATKAASAATSSRATASDNKQSDKAFDIHFHIKDETSGRSLSNIPYKITLADGKSITGKTDSAGLTAKIAAISALVAKIEAPYYGDSTSNTNTSSGHDTCYC